MSVNGRTIIRSSMRRNNRRDGVDGRDLDVLSSSRPRKGHQGHPKHAKSLGTPYRRLQNSHLVDMRERSRNARTNNYLGTRIINDARTLARRLLDERPPNTFTRRLHKIRTRFAEETKHQKDFEDARSSPMKLRVERQRLTRIYRNAVKEAGDMTYDHTDKQEKASIAEDLALWLEDE